MFIAAGFEELVEFARSRPGPKEVFARMPANLIDHVALVGTESEVRRRIDEYRAAGIAELAIVPPAPDHPSARRTLEALAPEQT
jgi:alkanesulfonate monooxygenase SsuD/methylene tetrahydromethanopterin reductase-like flavin-dependent oxidoreductase (luciferase family)